MKRMLIAALAAGRNMVPKCHAAMAGPAAPAVPDAIAVTGAHKPYLIAHAEGVQIYACYSVADGYAWRLLSPRATLTSENGAPLGSHYGGPTWEARDGSTRHRPARDGRLGPSYGGRLAAAQKADKRAAGARRRPPRRRDLHPADQHGGRAPAGRGRLRRGHRRRVARDPL